MAEQTPPVPDDHTNAVARAISIPDWGAWSDDAVFDHNKWTYDGSHRSDEDRAWYREMANHALMSTDAAVLDAFEAALVRAGRLTERERHYRYENVTMRRLVTEWREDT